jgi:hypothetical protein
MYNSPFSTFGAILIAPGSERVQGPDNSAVSSGPNPSYPVPSNPGMVLYHRTGLIAPLSKQPSEVDTATGMYKGFASGPLNYKLDMDLNPLNPLLVFDQSVSVTPPPQGIPAVPASAPANQQRFLDVTYLWQNNYRRDNAGFPLDEDGRRVAGRGGRPEPDIFKVDYSTRNLINLRLGVRVYDASSGRPQTFEVSDKVKIQNVGR